MRADTSVRLDWTGEGLAFRGGAEGGPEVMVDSDGVHGPSPTNFLLLSLAGCMGVDVIHILEKSRVPLESLSVEAEAERAEEPPRRFRRVRLVYTVSGPTDEHADRLERAVELSRDKYCSVLHTLKSDLELDVEIHHA